MYNIHSHIYTSTQDTHLLGHFSLNFALKFEEKIGMDKRVDRILQFRL